MRQLLSILISGGLAVFAGTRCASAASDRGAQLAGTCASCHRLDGRDVAIPSIVGLDEETLTRTLRAFQSGERPSQIMHVMSLSLSDDEIATVARYLATLRAETGKP